MRQYTLFIDGRRTEAASGRRYDSVDPFLGEPWASAADGDAADVDAAVAAARRALAGPWGQLTGFGRARLMRRLGDLIARDAGRLGEIETRDTGKLLREMRGQLGTIPEWFYYFSGLADKLEGSTIPVDKPNFLVYTRREPAGVVAAIVPWNSPLLLLCWKLAPALAAGCTMVAKPSDYSPASAVELAALMDEAGFPPGVFNVVTGLGGQGRGGQHHRRSPGTGRQVRAPGVRRRRPGRGLQRGAGRGVRRHRADLHGRVPAAGQPERARRAGRADRGAGPVDPAGRPQGGRDRDGPGGHRTAVPQGAVVPGGAAAEGATVAAGGRPEEALGGYFVQPTVLTGVKPTMTVACEEVFGPVLAVMPFDGEDEAVALANDSRYGLAGAVWTKDIHRAHRVAHALRTGTVWINAYRVVGPDVPFGGFGQSGLGRENGIEAVHEYTQTKAVWVELSGGTRDPFTLG